MIVFDKTGTLTIGRPALLNKDEIALDDLNDAARLARNSRHPLSRAIVEAAGKGTAAFDAHEIAGSGVEAMIGDEPCRLGAAAWVGAPPDTAQETEVWFRRGANTPIRFVFSDMPHQDAKSVIEALGTRDLPVQLLSGDNAPIVSRVAATLGIDQYKAAMRPEQKLEFLTEQSRAGAKIAMIGDGLNDAPSLANAHVSLSPGSAAGCKSGRR